VPLLFPSAKDVDDTNYCFVMLEQHNWKLTVATGHDNASVCGDAIAYSFSKTMQLNQYIN